LVEEAADESQDIDGRDASVVTNNAPTQLNFGANPKGLPS